MPAELLVPPDVARWVSPRPWLQVREATPARLRLEGREHPLTLVWGLPKLSAPMLLQLVAQYGAQSGTLPVICSSYLSSEVRASLEREATSYIDGRGHLHLIAPGVLIHLEGSGPVRKAPQMQRLGVDGVRTVQALLENNEPVSVSRLAERAAVSVGQAHKVLTWLEQLGFAHTTGKGPATRRIISNRSAVLDWLEQQPNAKRKGSRLDVALYARRPEELWFQVSTRLKALGAPHAFTGAAAASLYGVGPTSVPRSLVRIAPQLSLEVVASHLGAEVTDRGPNLTLLSDTGSVGCTGAVEQKNIQVAPAVRIYLDAQTERRGEDVAQQFREVVLGY